MKNKKTQTKRRKDRGHLGQTWKRVYYTESEIRRFRKAYNFGTPNSRNKLHIQYKGPSTLKTEA